MKKLKLFFACLLMAVLSIGQVWAAVESGTTYGVKSASTAPTDWSTDGEFTTSGGGFIKLIASTNYIQTDEFCQGGFTSIKIKARKFGGPDATQGKIHVEWYETGVATPVELGTVSPSGTSLADLTISSPADVTANKTGYIKISCKGASNSKGCGISEVTISYTAGTCSGSVTPTCATPTFSPKAGSYEGTQNVTISSTAGATIYYTIDGSDPSTSSSVYSSAIPVSANTTIKAYAVKSDYNDSEVATAAYTITEGPDVTIDFTDNTEWGFPTSNTLDEGTFSDGTYTVKVKGEGTGKGYKFSSGKLLIGQNGAYLLLPEFANPIAKIVCPGISGASGSVKWNVYDGETAVSTEVTGCTSDVTFNIDPVEANKQYKIKLNSAHNLQISHIKIYYGVAPAVAKPTISGAENFVTSTTVTLSHDDADAIYYTTDGSKPTTSSNLYSAPFELNATATVKAIAVKGSDVSSVAEKTFTKVEALTTMDAIFAAATTAGSTATDKFVTFNNWVVSAVTSNNAFVTDGTKGFIMYANSHGFNVGDVLNGTVACKVQLYKGSAELTNVTSATEGLTVTAGGAATVNTLTIDQLGAINTGAVVKIENVAYDGTNLSDGTNTIKPYNKLFAYSMESGKDYNVTGVIDYYDALQIMPRSAADVEEITAAGAPDAPTFSPAAGTYNEVQNVTISCATDGVTIYYTTDGNVPTTSSSVYSTPIAVSADMTIKAIAVKNDVESAVATATYFINVPLTTMDAIFAKATAVGTTATDVTIVLNNWVVSGIYSNNKDVFVTDGSKGFIIYDGGAAMGFNVGDVLSGTVACKVQLYHGAAEVTNLSSSTTGLTVTPDGSAALNTKTIDQLGAINTGALVKIENLTYNSTSKKLSDGVNEITPYKGIFSSMAFTNGKKYDVTGVVSYYDALQIMPRTADDIEEIVLPDPELSYSPASAEIQVGGAWSAPTLNNPNSVSPITYSISGDAVATVSNEGVIALVENATGTATITASFAGDATYAAGNATYTITVNEAAPVLTDYYEKVTSGTVAEGTYLIVYETTSVAFDGSLTTLDAAENTIDVEITTAHQIAVTQETAASTFYIDPTAGTVQAASGKYIGVGGNSNGLKTSDDATAYTHNFSFDASGNAVIAPNFEGSTMSLRYNTASNQARFRYYKDNGQQPIALYKLANEVVKADPGISWDPELAELTLTDYITPGDYPEPVLTILADLGDNPLDFITLSSDNESLATINKTNDGQIKISWVPDVSGTVHFTATYPGNDTYKAVTAVCTVTIKPANSIYVAPSLYVNFGSVEKDAVVADKSITVTLTNVDAATLTLAGDGASAFTISPAAALTASGDITISASSATAGTFAATLTISDDANQAESKVVNLSLKVNEPTTEETAISTTSKWVAATAIVDGMQVLITGVASEVVYAMGEQKSTNRAAYVATLNEGVLTPGEGTMAFTLVAQGDGTYAIRTSNGKYLYAAASGSNHLKTQDEVDVNAKWTLTIESAVAEGSSNRNIMRFNSGSSKLFSCYSSGQQPIKFYVPKQETPEPPTPAYTDIRTGLTAGNYFTICWPKAMTAIKGATLWSFAGKDADFAYIVKESAPFEAGKPYLAFATADKLEAVLEGDDALSAGENNGLHGTFDYMDAVALEAAGATYMLYQNELHPIGSNNHLAANRAYIVLSEIPAGAPSQMPGREVRKMPMQGTEAQGVDNLNASETPVKMMIDGQLFIIRGEHMFDATGRLVK